METVFPSRDINEALTPYIKTRQEVQAIRTGLQSTFPLSPVQIVQPASALEKLVDPTPLSGVRRAYWKALQAHQEAQSRYDALKAELAKTSAPAQVHDNPGLLASNYLPLLRQREKHRRLEIVQRAYTKINAAGGATIGESFDSSALLGLGDLPAPPPTALSDRDLTSDADELIVKLKKAVLSARQHVDEHNLTVAQAGDVSSVAANPHAELRALQSAHSELTLWMEDQLALISDVSGAAEEANGAATSARDAGANAAVSASAIESLYEQYLDARNKLLDTIEVPPPTRLAAVPMALASGPGDADAGDAEQRPTPSEAVLPFLARLAGAKQQELRLLQQSAYARRQVARAEDDARRVVARLADESHLVPPGAAGGKDWAAAAAHAGHATVEFAAARTRAGAGFADAAAKALESIKSLPESVGALAPGAANA